MAQIARTIAKALRLNEELVEAIALAHDLGHTPFGHSGEDTLADLMKGHGGFDHNTHGLRVVDVLEKRYPDFCGLNLSQEVRRGIIRHSTPFDQRKKGAQNIPGVSLLEIQVVDIADEIAYDNHDLDDGLKSGLLSKSDLAGIPIWDETVGEIEKSFPGIDEETKRSQIVRHLINLQVSDILENTLKRINELAIEDVSSLEDRDGKTVGFSETMAGKRTLFKAALMDKLYNHYRVVRMSNKASRFLRDLFKLYSDNPAQLPPQALEHIEERGKFQVICDYMAGMTDRYALDQYKKLFEPYERV